MRGFFRFIIAIFFIFFFILFLGLGAIRFRILNYQFWTKVLTRAGAYNYLAGQTSELTKNIITAEKIQELRKLQKSGKLNAQQKIEVEKTLKVAEAITGLDKVLTAEKIQELIEENLKRFLSFIKDKKEHLVLYLPIQSLGLPSELTSQPPLSLLNDKTDIQEFYAAIGQPGEAEKAIAKFDQIRNLISYLPLIWIGLLVLAILTLTGHFFLGKGKVGKIKGTSLLLLISGLLAVTVAMVVSVLVSSLLSQSTQIPPILISLLSTLVEQFFSFGKTIGIIVAVIGLVGLGTIIYLVRVGKIEIEKEQLKEKGKKRIGCLLVVGLVVFLLIIGIASGKIRFSFEKTGTKTGQQSTCNLKLANALYTSKNGWSMCYPQGWQTKIDDQIGLVGFIKPGQDKKDWVFVAVETSERPPGKESKDFMLQLKNVLTSGSLEDKFPNMTLVGEPVADEWQGWQRIIFVFEHDYGQGSNRARQLRRYLFPPKEGKGFLIYSQTPVGLWEKYRPIIEESMDSFRKN